MKTFQYINQPYSNPIDLATVNNTFSILQERHDEAIKASSELKSVIGSLELNEAEDGFRQELYNSVVNTIDQNTIHGNAAAAYDDIIKLSGDIVSNPKLISKLKAQQDYIKYITELDARVDLPQDYKDIYKELNPYYEGEYDEQGNWLRGTKWTPTDIPNTHIPLSDIVTQAMQNVAEERGDTVLTRWLDKDGKPTTNPEEAFDGEIFDVTTNTYQRLGRDKIVAAIKSVIAETPGAQESLNQDFKIAEYKYNKVKDKPNRTPEEEKWYRDMVNENGITLTRGEYEAKRFNDAAAIRAYNYSNSKTTYGKGLSTYKAAQKALDILNNDGENTGNTYFNPKFYSNESSTRSNPVRVKVNRAAEYEQIINSRKEIVYDIFRSAGWDEKSIDEEYERCCSYEDVNDYLATIDNPVIKSKLKLASIKLEEAEINLDNMRSVMDDEDKAKFDFANRMSSGGKLISSENGGSVYDDTIINEINALFGDNGEYLKITLDAERYKLFTDIVDNPENLGIDVKNKGNDTILKISKVNSFSIPQILSIVKNIERNTKRGLFGVFGKNNIPCVILDSNGNPILPPKYEGPFKGSPELDINYYANRLAGTYDYSKNIHKELFENYGVNPTEIELGHILQGDPSFGYAEIMDKYTRGLIDNSTKNSLIKDEEDRFKSVVTGTDFSQYKMYYSEDGEIKEEILDSGERYRIGQFIKSEYLKGSSNRVTHSADWVSGIYDRDGNVGGYTFTYSPEINQEGTTTDKNTKPISVYIPGFDNEEIRKVYNGSPSIRAWDSISILGETKTYDLLSSSAGSPYIGDAYIQGLGANNFEIGIFGKTFIGDNLAAQTVKECFILYDELSTLPLYNITDEQQLQRINNVIDDIATKLSSITGIDKDFIGETIGIELTM